MAARHESHILIGGKKLLRQMNVRGLSGAQLARSAGVSPTTISAIMTREQRVTVKTARKISDVLWRTQKLPGLVEILADSDEVA